MYLNVSAETILLFDIILMTYRFNPFDAGLILTSLFVECAGRPDPVDSAKGYKNYCVVSEISF